MNSLAIIASALTLLGPGWAKTAVNAPSFRESALATGGGYQYAAWYYPDGFVALAKRPVGGGAFETVRTRLKGNVRDGHNSISLGIDADGYLHVAFDMHSSSVKYCRSSSPHSLELDELQPMTGEGENVATYPEFHRVGETLLFVFRSGVSGNGNLVMNRYDRETRTWTRMQSNLVSGEGRRNAYWQMRSRGGVLHLAWCWRETAQVETNHDICYARSRDGGVTWERSDGTAYELPITEKTAEVAVRVPQGRELINQTGIDADENGNPCIATYWRDENSAVPQYRFVWHDGKAWHVRQVGNRKEPFSLSGGGTKMIPIARPRVLAKGAKAWMFVRDLSMGGEAAMYVTEDFANGAWRYVRLTDFSVHAWEPNFDSSAWDEGRIELFIQDVYQGDGEKTVEHAATDAYVLEISPDVSSAAPVTAMREEKTDLDLPMQPEAKIEWMRDAKIGMFIHWGLYAGPGKGEWFMAHKGIKPAEYATLATAYPVVGGEAHDDWSFTADKYDPDRWMEIAKSMGARYVCLTAQHHDGYALFESRYPGAFSSWNTHGRDFVREYVEAARRAGMRVGLYKTLINWRHPGYYDVTGEKCAKNSFGYETDSAHKEDARIMKEELYAQTRELMSNYGKIDYLFWDGGWLAQRGSDADAAWFWESGKWRERAHGWQIGEKWGLADAGTGRPLGLMGMVRSLQPDLVCNLRSGWCGDFICEEGPADVKGPVRGGLVEKCMSVTPAWGYTAEKPPHLAGLSKLERICADCMVRGMNFLLNVGPDRHGEVPCEVATHLARFGEWVKTNAEAIYATRGGPWNPVEGKIGFTQKGNTVYVWLLDSRASAKVQLPPVRSGVKAVGAYCVANGREVGISQSGDIVTIENIPSIGADIPVIAVVFQIGV